MTEPLEFSEIILQAAADLAKFERDFLAEGAAIDEREREEQSDADTDAKETP